MAGRERSQLRVFFDSSCVIAGSASSTGASYALLQLADLGLIDGRISAEVREEAYRNVRRKLPAALPMVSLLIREALTEGTPVSTSWLRRLEGQADPKDLAILASALKQECQFLVTLNERDFWPEAESIEVVRPGALVVRVREALTVIEPFTDSDAGPQE